MERFSKDMVWDAKTAVVVKSEFACRPPEILQKQRLLRVDYVDFSTQEQTGYIVVHEDVIEDVQAFFILAKELKFPIAKVVPAVAYDFDDSKMMNDNNSSGFNYRNIAGTSRLSNHSFGKAFDINPHQNPYIRYLKNGTTIIEPLGATYDASAPGTLTSKHSLVTLMESRGWHWGGRWTPDTGRTDYQHFGKE